MINIEKLTNVKLEPCRLGGTGRKFFITIDGKKYIYKPSENRYSYEPEPFRGIVQELAYQIQYLVDPETSIFCQYINNGELNGTIQEYVDVEKPNLVGVRPAYLTETQINDILREFVVDTLLCNFDAHARNMIIDKNGRIRGVDKEQSYRYINSPEADKPNLTFHPNRRYSELPPYYYEFFEAVQNKEIEINLDVLDYYLDKVTNLDNMTFSKMIIPYVDSLPLTNEEKKERLEKLIYRKYYLRDNIYSFIRSLGVKVQKGEK